MRTWELGRSSGTFSGSPGRGTAGDPSDSQIKKVHGDLLYRWALQGRRRNTGSESRHSDPGETLGPRAGERPHPARQFSRFSTGWPAEAGIRSSLISGDTLPGVDRRRELERGAWSSEGEVQTHRPKGHPKMRDRGAPCPPLERGGLAEGGERGCSKRTLKDTRNRREAVSQEARRRP